MPRDKTIVAIHQPNFFPWLGYFNKIAYADVFVILDSVQFSKTGGTWSNRVRLKVKGKAKWVTVPVARAYHGVRRIEEMRFSRSDWRPSVLRTLQSAYGRTRHFDAVFPLVAKLISNPTDVLVEYNLAAIRALTAALRLDSAEFVLASSLAVAGKGTDLLVAVVKGVRGTAYLCGSGASGYQEDAKFPKAGIDLIHQDFCHPAYQQGSGEFIAGLSIVDALMNCGFEETQALVLSSHPAVLPQAARQFSQPGSTDAERVSGVGVWNRADGQ
ncbi:MAG: WbqC family protein [bacterium]